jgi:hypothetical protein
MVRLPGVTLFVLGIAAAAAAQEGASVGLHHGDGTLARLADQPWFPEAPPLPAPAGAVVRVGTVDELARAIDAARPGVTILLADGHYAMTRYLEVRADDVVLRSASGDRARVVLDGGASRHGEVLGVGGCSGVTVADLTIRNARTNAFKINSDRFATKVTLRNCVLHNVWQRGVKGPAVRVEDRARFRPGDCRIEYCLFYNDHPKRFEDDPRDTPETFDGNYVGGIDAMYARRWTISDNVFIGLRGRTGQGRGAVFLWQESEDCVVERNVIIDCDAGVCLGNAHKPADVEAHCRGCVVRNNFVTRAPQAGIAAVHTRDCRIVHNTVFDPASRLGRLVRVVRDNDGLVVANNLLGNKPVLVEGESRVEMRGNVSRDLAGICTDVERGNLHLRARTKGVSDSGEPIGDLGHDIDRHPRDANADVGADEFRAP